MVILDTNVISELMHVAPDAKVIAWMDRQPRGFDLDYLDHDLRGYVRIGDDGARAKASDIAAFVRSAAK